LKIGISHHTLLLKTMELNLKCFAIIAIWLCFQTSELTAQKYNVALDPVSSENAEFGATFFQDGVVFCSNRNQKLHMNDSDSLQQFRTDLFFYRPEAPEVEATLFAKDITTWLNEGPATFNEDQTVMFYSGNIEPKNLTKKDKVKIYKLGIFEAHLENGIWLKKNDFPYNSSNNKYNVAHPTLSKDGKTLIFASNMPGGIGGSDLYMSTIVDGNWSEPIMLPEPINSEAGELFPYLDERGRLYFSSNVDGGDMDVYCTVRDEAGNWRKPFALEAPVNSEYDDFGFICRDHQTQGFFSTNRIDSIDNLYNFRSGFPDFEECKEVKNANFCYLIEEENIMDIGDLPLRYVWDLGDGNTAEGLSVKHCFENTGDYKVSLNIIDTLTGLTYSEVSTLDLKIEMPKRGFFNAPDTLRIDQLAELNAMGDYLGEFDLDEWHWDLGDGNLEMGENSNYAYTEEGNYRLKLGGLTLPDAMGNREETCVYKDIVVVGKEREIVQFEDPRFRTKELQAAIDGKRNVPKVESGDLSTTFFVEVLKSDKRIPYNAPVFSKIPFPITERFEAAKEEYIYSVGEGSSMSEVYSVFKNLADSGYKDMSVKGEEIASFFKETMKKGNFIAKNDTTSINNEFKKLQDIRFEYNSHEILAESFPNLNYIIAMLEVEPSYRVSIKAHTDQIGGYGYNQKLSEKRAESVVDYFKEKGILKNRMEFRGYGDTKPIATNETEEGRAQNRRVEFEIIEMTNVAEK